jgi:Fe-S-cluster containining protein
MGAYCPRLRAEVAFVEGDGGRSFALYDPLIERQVNLGPVALAVAQRLDGRRSIDEIAEAVRAELPLVSPDAVLQALRQLLLLLMIEGANPAILERIRAVKAGALLPFSVLAEGRFQCQGSGECCQNYHFGPLTDADIAELDRLAPEIERRYPELGPGPYFQTLEVGEGRKERFLKAQDERCIFLQPDLRCGLHAEFGPDSKPGICRLYPLASLATIEGVKLYDNGECASFATSARSGPALREDIERVKRLFPEKYSLYHPIVLFEPQAPADYGYFLALQQGLVEVAGTASAGSTDILVALGRLLREYIDALGSCAVVPGGPEAAAARVLGAGRARLFPPARPEPRPEEVRRGCEAVAQVASRLMRACAEAVIRSQPSPKDLLTARLSREITQVLHFLGSVAAHRADPAGEPLTDFYRYLAAIPWRSPDIEDAFRLSFRQVVFGQKAMIEERPVAGLLRLALAYLVTIFGARLRAGVEGSKEVRRPDFDFGHMLAQRVLRQTAIASVFVAEEARAWPVLDAVATLA